MVHYPDFPHPTKINQKLKFSRGYFENTLDKSERYKILRYSTNIIGWNSKLTDIALHDINKDHPIDVASRQRCIELLEKHDHSEKKITLEIGCSNGNLISNFQEINKYNYVGSDAQSPRIMDLARLYSNIPFIEFDLIKNPFLESTFNNIVMLNVLEHIENDQLALDNVFKILEKNGLLIIEVPAVSFLYDDYDKQLLHFRRYDMKNLIDKLINSGFMIEKKTHLGFMVFPFFFITKLINKIFKKKVEIIKMANISDNIVLKVLFKIEKKLSNFSLPFGVRCYVCARKK